MTGIKFGDVLETVITRKEFPLSKARQVLKNEIVAIIGYGIQGQAQALNLSDNKIKVIVGQRKYSSSWDKAIADGWKEGRNLFSIDEAAKWGTIIAYLLSDAGQAACWPILKKHLSSGKALYLAHGFGIVYQKQTKIIPPKNIDVIMVAPYDLGRLMRQKFVRGSFISSSFAVSQDFTGRAKERVLALGIAVGCGVLFKTTFKNEVYSDLTSERGVLLGALAAVMEAQYNELRENGHNPSEAFYTTVEELTQNIIQLVGENGMDWMYANCSTTAQRGALDWKDEFKKAVAPVFKKLYDRVKRGIETKRVLEANSKEDYKRHLEKELSEMRNSEMWRVGKIVRSFRTKKIINNYV